ncbi:hypothetical protein [Parachlamydia acanthamoebae]|jgi:hypothetical protein|uniref:hypothetical protein n=1 Tax=Parachlamydia acanthamoebae TaxID=83552 RepID=UPI0024E1D5A1|nr:hypothetical protein [Parachlamydia acanthamoebae]
MNRLDTASYYLSYTDFVPIISIPSGIVHLICAIRDRAFGTPPSKSNDPINIFSLTRRKLDNWSHVTKGVLALIPFLGNFILVCKWLKRQDDFSNVSLFLNGHNAFLKEFPKKLFNDKEFLLALFKEKPFCFKTVFGRTPDDIKNDKPFILSLINDKHMTFYAYEILQSLKEDRDIIEALIAKDPVCYQYFQKLPKTFQNDLDIIKKIFAIAKKRDSSYPAFIKHVPNKNILKENEELYITAVSHGIFKFKELDTARQYLLQYGIAAVLHDHHQWHHLPEHLKKNKILLEQLIWFAICNTSVSWEATTNEPWFKQFWNKETAPPPNRQEAKHMLEPKMQLLLTN